MNHLALGIPGVEELSPGTHVCALYSRPVERDRLLYSFLEEGLRHGDKCLCLIDDVEATLVRDRVVGQLNPGNFRRSGQLDVERASDAYLRTGTFSVGDMLGFLSESVDAAVGDEFELLRVAGEMSWVPPGPPGWDDLVLYESAVNRAVWRMPAIFMCLYDLQRFGAGLLVDVLATHPKVLVDCAVDDHPRPAPSTDPPPTSGAAAARYPMVRLGEAGDHGWASLTDAERRVTSRVSRGMTNRTIAEELHLSPHTVDAHLKHVYLKLDIHSRVELTVLALRHEASPA